MSNLLTSVEPRVLEAVTRRAATIPRSSSSDELL